MAKTVISHLLVHEKEARKISYRQIAREAGISHTTVVKAIEGRGIELPTAIAVCKWLGVSLSILDPQLEAGQSVEFDYLQKTFPGLADKMLALANCYTSGLLSRSDVHVLLTIIDLFISRTIWTGNTEEDNQSPGVIP